MRETAARKDSLRSLVFQRRPSGPERCRKIHHASCHHHHQIEIAVASIVVVAVAAAAAVSIVVAVAVAAAVAAVVERVVVR